MWVWILAIIIAISIPIIIAILIVKGICDYLAEKIAEEFKCDYLAQRIAEEICRRMLLMEKRRPNKEADKKEITDTTPNPS